MTTQKLEELLMVWEETYKKGQLTLWIFLALRDSKKYVDEIRQFVIEYSNHTMSCEEQSLYRNLRKYKHLGVVNFEMRKGNRGADRKYYFLTDTGEQLLIQFTNRNIGLFFNTKIYHLLEIQEV